MPNHERRESFEDAPDADRSESRQTQSDDMNDRGGLKETGGRFSSAPRRDSDASSIDDLENAIRAREAEGPGEVY